MTGVPWTAVRAITSSGYYRLRFHGYFVSLTATNGVWSPIRSTNPGNTKRGSVMLDFFSGRKTLKLDCDLTVSKCICG